MKRTTLAVSMLGLLATGLLMAAGKGQHEYVYGDIDITGVDSFNWTQGTPYPHVVAISKAGLHAIFTKRGITVDTKRIDAIIDTDHKVARTAKLTGGVKGTLTGGVPGDARNGEFTGNTVNYTNRSDVDPGASDLDATGGVTFKETLEKKRSSITLTGTHGTFQVRTVAGSVGLASAEVDGPVSFAVLQEETTAKKSSQSHMNGKGDHLTLTRTGPNGTEYLVTLTGNVTFNGVVQGVPGSGQAAKLTIHLDASFQLIDFNADQESGVATPQGNG